jgi:H+/Cl- antiporter ClcA
VVAGDAVKPYTTHPTLCTTALLENVTKYLCFLFKNQKKSEPAAWVPKLFQYLGFNLGLAGAASLAVFLVSPPAAGSGIPDVVAYLNGAEGVGGIDRFFSVRTFAAKVVGSALAVASSLAMGKEGPMLHAGSILAVIVGAFLFLFSGWLVGSSGGRLFALLCV